MTRGSTARLAATLVCGLLVGGAASGCSLLGGDSGKVAVFDVQPGDCLASEEKVQAQISELEVVPCEEQHAQEAYARISYRPPGAPADADEADENADFPGDDALVSFADGACATAFGEYVGVDYLDSELFFSYLMPTPRSWEDDDREVLCVLTGAGQPLEGSMKGAAR
ncbi:septum formation family protein [Nocardioides sp.]|uniref:septum formation family protein n=1 Tax=Nocardioides sp. TaxID=35761 RepID=UPI00273644A6|nr:septum formation family protein [Nocardioides sp.]MDP3892570.1 septum formation family protein [Nocardioides sp.]